MSSPGTGFPENQQSAAAQVNTVGHIPTEEERRVFKECNQETVPFSVVSMAITQALVSRGTLSASPRFGSQPKVAFAGFCGYLTGKLSYKKTCQEKFKRLENSPLGPQSELNDPDVQSFDSRNAEPHEPSRKPILCEDLRLKNRENYEVTLSQTADSMLQAPAEKEPERPKKTVKKNIYGDAWED
uniref:OCIA domain-containing protein 1 n=1 Tax=Salarias fasciatus TaxID=181472 RepID=A0A672F225_SALFA